MFNRVLFSSATSEWETPQELFARLHAEFGFTLDVCARPWNAKCTRYFSPEQNGLIQEWAPETCWMNPPYGREISRWVRKAWEEAQKGATVVCLLPSRTDTAWWHEYVMRAAEIRFIRGRLHFEGAKNGAPFPSCVVVFRPGCTGPPVIRSMAAR
ncbi:DNA N-6-adenine-methyltransferase [Desulfovirgula thermocuniculi]|uniref:DNA N-6-adenine-methyltransferase n=1 Tax=Desulfovirgula thermocuniculi TaxID=348842 RepID=UPI000416E308|nr:DNA N-6-adenine-methyltransferase [Desulfovirgula thermocuniculi]